MNIDFVKEKVEKLLSKKVRITVHGMRNKICYYEGIINNIYPNIFTIMENGFERSFSYRDLVTKDITMKELV